MTTQIRIPPQNLNAERSVLGCQILVGTANATVREILEVTDYYSDIHQVIQRAINSCMDDMKAVDIVILADRLAEMGSLVDIGGPAYLVELLETVPHAAHVKYYADIVLGHSRRRKAISIGNLLVQKMYECVESDEDIIQAAHDAAMEMAKAMRVKANRPRPISEHVVDVIDMYRRGESPVVKWGIPSIDEFIGGYTLGSLIVIGASTGHGKSMIALQWLDCAASHGVPGMTISVEMPESQLARRSMRYLSGMTEAEMRANPDKIFEESATHFQSRARVLVCKEHAIGKAVQAITRAVQSDGVKLVVIDYAQLIKGPGDTEEQRIANVSGTLKQLAMEQDIIVILLAQLNREIDKRGDATPRVSDLKGSAALGADADFVLLPFWPSKYDESYLPKDEYRIHLGKSRDGAQSDSVLVMRVDGYRQTLHPARPDSEQGFDPAQAFEQFR